MSTVYVIARVPAALRDKAEAAVLPYALSPPAPGAYAFSVPLSADGNTPPTAYGLCAPVDDGGSLYAAMPALKAAFPGSDCHAVPVASYDLSRDWLGWMAAAGLQPVRPKTP